MHLQAHDDPLLVINARDLFADTRFADEKVYYTRLVGETVSDVQDKGWSAGLRILIFHVRSIRARLAFVTQRYRHSSDLACWRALGLRFRAD